MDNTQDKVNVLALVEEKDAARYLELLRKEDRLHTQVAHSIADSLSMIADRDHRIDVFVMDNALEGIFGLIRDLRHSYPRLLLILVDELADFGLPGQADEFTNEPFKNDDLLNRINRLIFERRQETLRSDSLPAMREISQALRSAIGIGGKQQAAVDVILNMEYDYVGYYHRDVADQEYMILMAQSGPKPILSVAPKQTSADDIMTWVAQNNQTRLASYGDSLNHPLVAKGRLGTVACIPVAFDNRFFGVIVACRERPDSILQDQILMLELVAAQLGSAIHRELKN